MKTMELKRIWKDGLEYEVWPSGRHEMVLLHDGNNRLSEPGFDCVGANPDNLAKGVRVGLYNRPEIQGVVIGPRHGQSGGWEVKFEKWERVQNCWAFCLVRV